MCCEVIPIHTIEIASSLHHPDHDFSCARLLSHAFGDIFAKETPLRGVQRLKSEATLVIRAVSRNLVVSMPSRSGRNAWHLHVRFRIAASTGAVSTANEGTCRISLVSGLNEKRVFRGKTAIVQTIDTNVTGCANDRSIPNCVECRFWRSCPFRAGHRCSIPMERKTAQRT